MKANKVYFLTSFPNIITVGSPLFTKISSVPYRTVPKRNRPSIVLKIAHHLNGFGVKNAI